jgi:uncharacterized protein YigA (DUF484 family)
MIYENETAIAVLEDVNGELSLQIAHLKNTNRILRTVNSALRAKMTSLMEQIELAKQNDEMFKQFCNIEIGAEGSSTENAGLAST